MSATAFVHEKLNKKRDEKELKRSTKKI